MDLISPRFIAGCACIFVGVLAFSVFWAESVSNMDGIKASLLVDGASNDGAFVLFTELAGTCVFGLIIGAYLLFTAAKERGR